MTWQIKVGTSSFTDEVIFNIADVQANGGGTWYPMYSPDKKNLNYWSEFSKIFDKFNKIPNLPETATIKLNKMHYLKRKVIIKMTILTELFSL